MKYLLILLLTISIHSAPTEYTCKQYLTKVDKLIYSIPNDKTIDPALIMVYLERYKICISNLKK